MELVTLAAVMAASIGLGLIVSGAMLWVVLFLMTRDGRTVSRTVSQSESVGAVGA